MKGERLISYRIAAILRMPVNEVREALSFSEWLDWCAYVREEEDWKAKVEWLLAQIACEVKRSVITEPHKIKVSDFLPRFMPEGMNPEAVKKMNVSKQAWAAALGIKLDQN